EHRRRHVDTRAQFGDGADHGVDLDGAAGFEVLQHRGLEIADIARLLDARLSPMAMRSTARTPGSSAMTPMVADVSTLTGLKATLPQSFIQIASRIDG